MHNNHYHRATAHLQLNIIIIIIRGSIKHTKLFLGCYVHGLLHIFENTDSEEICGHYKWSLEQNRD